MGIFAARATSFAGEEEIWWPRPRARSGCVMRARSPKSGCAGRGLRVGAANWGVPEKRMRIFTPLRPPTGRLRPLPLALFPELFDFALDDVALQHAEMLEKENAVEVIDLMAEGAGEKIFAANFVGLAFGVLSLHGDD